MFPGLTQKQIKQKFKVEEIKNNDRINAALRNRKKAPADLKRKLLLSVKNKKLLEDSVYLNKNPASQDYDSVKEKTKEIPHNATEDTEVQAPNDSTVEEESRTVAEPEIPPAPAPVIPIPIPQLPPLELPELTTIKKGPIKGVVKTSKSRVRKKAVNDG
jgi:hypothetical protein